jgi:hypothetical protein
MTRLQRGVERETAMGSHESSVNYQNLIRDLAEMYPFEVAEVIIIELIANSLDAHATRISVDFDPRRKVLTVTDNGKGMNATWFEEYHDFAAGLKARGEGIGFAGLGAKISFNVAERVVTETRSRSFSHGSNWFLQSKKKLVWEDIQPAHLSGSYGTRVEVDFRSDARISYSSTQDLSGIILRHYLPLTDPTFLSFYEKMKYYSSDFRFIVNGQVIQPKPVVAHFDLDKVRKFFPKKAGKMFGLGLFGIAPVDYPVAPDICGVLLSTRGKVIKGELFNQFPGAQGPRIFGLVEVPGLARFLTTSKTDLIRVGHHREIEKLYDPIRQEFRAWLKDIGIGSSEIAGSDEAARLERELRRLLEDVPELGEFAGFRDRARILKANDSGQISANIEDGAEPTFPLGAGSKGEGPGPVDVGGESGQALVEDRQGRETVTPISRSVRRGPKITFMEEPERTDLAWIEGGNIIINSGHPCYKKTHSDILARRVHNLFAIASVVQRFLASQGGSFDFMFIDRMIAAWGRG